MVHLLPLLKLMMIERIFYLLYHVEKDLKKKLLIQQMVLMIFLMMNLDTDLDKILSKFKKL